MDQGTEIYRKDYRVLTEKLSCYPGITIASVDKDPPERYVIEYHLFGYGYDPNGTIQMLRRHRVEISLPFGYPHFPPTVKPLSRICHPNVAEHAIRIADFWQATPSLAELVIHIGDMIRGAVYTLDGPFNGEAASWYVANSDKLPLAELEYRDPHAVPEKPPRKAIDPGKLIVAGVAALLLTGGGLVVRDTTILSSASEKIQQIQANLEERKFREAEVLGREVVDTLEGVFFLADDQAALRQDVEGILQSDTLREGLAGRIKYQDKFMLIQIADTLTEIDRLNEKALARLAAGEVEAAVAIFQEAAAIAEKNGLEPAALEVKRLSAEKRLAWYVEQANAGYSERQWRRASELYTMAILIIDNEAGFLSAESAETRKKIDMLRILALASISREEAVLAEKEDAYGIAAERYRAITLLIERSGYHDDPVLAKIGADAEIELRRTAEQAMVEEGVAYLEQEYKAIFLKHYPGLYEPGLQSPRVRYIGRRDGRMVFIVSCIELVNRNTNEFRLYYQFDPDRRSWSLYREEK